MDVHPAIYRWIQRQRDAGLDDDKLVTALVFEHGYHLEVAQSIVRNAGTCAGCLLPEAGKPRPDVARTLQGDALASIPTFEGWEGRVVAEMFYPQVVVIRNFAPPAAIAALLGQYADCKQAQRSGEAYVQGVRDGLSLQRTGVAVDFADAAARALNWRKERLDEPLVLAYEEGQKFDLHYDFYSPRVPAHASLLKRFKNNARIGTLIVYLEAPEEGGGTYFGNLGFRVQLEAGDAVYFGYPADKVERCGTLHSGEQVLKGKKKIVTFAVHEKDIEKHA